MSATASAINEVMMEIGDPSRPLTQFRAQQILAEAKKLLKSRSDAVFGYSLMTVVYLRMKRPQEALDCARNAERLDPHFAAHKSNIGAALLDLGRPNEALEVLLQIDKKDANMVTRLNTAEAFFQLGLSFEAVDAFADATRIADHKSPEQLFILAGQAATIGLDYEAVELFARFVGRMVGVPLGNADAVEFIEKAPPEAMSILSASQFTALQLAVSHASHFKDVPAELRPPFTPPRILTKAEEDANDAVAMAVYEETRYGRTMATNVALAEDTNV